MKIALVYPDLFFRRPDWTGYFYVGVASLSAILKERGHETSLIHVIKPISKFDFIERVRSEAPDLIGFSSTSNMFPFVKKFASWLAEERIKVPTICGGIHPTIAPEESIGTEGIDMICRGEGEAPLAELCERIEKNEDIANISNLWMKRDGSIIKNTIRPLLDDLDTLPFSDRSIFDYQNLYWEKEGTGSFLVARGCHYSCSYCCSHLVRKIYGHEAKAVRSRSVDNVISEIKEVVGRYPFIKELVFDDAILFLKRNWSEEFAEKYSREVGLPFTCMARADLTNKVTVDLLKKAGCRYVKFGVESGNEYILKEVMNRRMSTDDIKKAFALCKEAGLITGSFSMVGVPCETVSTVIETIKLNATIGVDKMQVTIYQPYLGTELADRSYKQGFCRAEDLGPDFFSPSIVRLDTISPAQVLMFRDYFKILALYYRVLQKLPAGISKVSIRVSDRILSFVPVARVLNLCHVPLNYLYRQMLAFRFKAKVTWRKVGGRS